MSSPTKRPFGNRERGADLIVQKGDIFFGSSCGACEKSSGREFRKRVGVEKDRGEQTGEDKSKHDSIFGRGNRRGSVTGDPHEPCRSWGISKARDTPSPTHIANCLLFRPGMCSWLRTPVSWDRGGGRRGLSGVRARNASNPVPLSQSCSLT